MILKELTVPTLLYHEKVELNRLASEKQSSLPVYRVSYEEKQFLKT